MSLLLLFFKQLLEGSEKCHKSTVCPSQVIAAMQQPVQQAPPLIAMESLPLSVVAPVPPTDPMVRKQVVQDLMAQMQGTYNFMQVRLD